jgi:DNA ligase-associated metallophosphoesterase
MVDLISFFKPKHIIAVGDLFHSADNLELQLFSKIRASFSNMKLTLVQGNHDILEKSWYQRNKIEVVNSNYCLGDFNFVHDPAEIPKENTSFYFSGHLHPSISISGMGKQSLSFPCYFFTEHSAILPAFSKFSGAAKVKKKKSNRIFAIVENCLIEIEK